MLASSRRARRVVAVIATALFAASCVEAPTGPQHVRDDAAAADANLLGWILSQLDLLSCTPLPAATTTQVVGAAGGTINVGPHKLVIPAGALSSNVSITATAPSAPRREVQFQPHGLQFEEKATLTMSYAGCSLVSQILPKKIVYMDAGLNPLELILSLDNFLAKKVTGKIDHFSSYAVWQ
jgi:hypothetical protein